MLRNLTCQACNYVMSGASLATTDATLEKITAPVMSVFDGERQASMVRL